MGVASGHAALVMTLQQHYMAVSTEVATRRPEHDLLVLPTPATGLVLSCGLIALLLSVRVLAARPVLSEL